jgi:peptide deformylase
MAIREIIIYPDPCLKKPAERIGKIDESVLSIIQDLSDTLNVFSHTVGIASPQIGVSSRIIVIDASKNKKCDNHHGKTVLINPEIDSHNGIIQFREGCLSIPDFTGNVNRAKEVTVHYYDTSFNKQLIKAVNFEAVVLQHEIDHLNGILFLDRIISKRTDLFRRKRYQ